MDPISEEASNLGIVRGYYAALAQGAATRLRTRFAQVIELRAGRMVALRNYDCFYPRE